MGQRFALLAFWSVFAITLSSSLVANSPTLLAEAMHSLVDAVTASFGVYSIRLLSVRMEGYTYGMHRLEVISSFVNIITVIAGAIAGVAFAVDYLIRGSENDPFLLLTASSIAFGIMIVEVLIGNEEERNTGVWLHAMQDSISYLIGTLAGFAIFITGIRFIDPISAFVILALMLITSLKPLKESYYVLMERSPVDVNGVKEVIERSLGEVEDLHVWSICRHNRVATAHVRVSPEAKVGELEDKRKELEKILREKFGINHLTVQYEAEGCQKED